MGKLGEPCIACTIKHLLAAYAIFETPYIKRSLKSDEGIKIREMADLSPIRLFHIARPLIAFDKFQRRLPVTLARVFILLQESGHDGSRWAQNIDLAVGILTAESHTAHFSEPLLRIYGEVYEQFRELIGRYPTRPEKRIDFINAMMKTYFPDARRNRYSYITAHLREALRECPKGFDSTDRIGDVMMHDIPDYVAELRKEFEIPFGVTIIQQEDERASKP